MKKHEIVVGGYYRALVSGNVVTVKVDVIEDCPYSGMDDQPYKGRGYTAYHCWNLSTNKPVVFKSAAKFRCAAKNAVGNPADLSNQRWCDCDICGKRIMTESKDGFMVTRCSVCSEKYGEVITPEAAQELLSYGDNPPPIKDVMVEGFRKDMESGHTWDKDKCPYTSDGTHVYLPNKDGTRSETCNVCDANIVLRDSAHPEGL